ncbi:metallophosphoesterase [Lacticaseibacillus pabuli]|uniref:Metallophosphoesterase n=1 Tax=Lacticaseibacillus pabuli TaxID=3025672 RepID=A0ABY7WTG8_9LACO|nr:metallophosphoesterase [Lacticaseibacillus sp. KACC 23028]WDF83463.1 metallophosphoesterase [Lacticaseibacillus sp. KACC 23028]
MTVIAVSDIHGSMTVMKHVREMQAKHPDAFTIYLGDYFDGHEHSAQVMRMIMKQVADKKAIAVLGNHDAMFQEYMKDNANQALWFMNGGDATVQHMIKFATGKEIDPASDEARHDMFDNFNDIFEFVSKLPTIAVYGRMLYIHAGLDLGTANPISDTKVIDRLWIREDYIYRTDRSEAIFAHNPLDYTIVTGHTPTGLIAGRFDNSPVDVKEKFPHCPILKIQYEGEEPRYFIDGGVHSALPENQGNIAVFDEETGELVDSLQTRP